MSRLGVWKKAKLVGHLTSVRAGLRFDHDEAFIESIGLGRPIISMSLPTSARPYPDRAARPYFDGLLPEGEARRIIAYDFGVSEADTMQLLAILGRDCAGALSILPADKAPAPQHRASELPALERTDVDALIASLRMHPLGVDDTVRASLGGVQEKLLLTQLADGAWALPTANVASTHILKPAILGLAESVVNEALCLQFAAQVGVHACAATVDHFADRDVLVVQRFDRLLDAAGRVDRSHQETACQALAVPVAATTRKYEDSGGPSLKSVARLLARWSAPEQLDELLRQTTINVLVGNADAHAMNISFLIDDDGTVTLSPMYDVFSTVVYPQLSTAPGLRINGLRDIRTIRRADIAAEAVSWGVDVARAKGIVDEVCKRSATALAGALAHHRALAVPLELADFLAARIQAVATS